MQALNDWHLAMGVMILVLVDLTILKIYTLVERFQGNLSAIRVPNRENPRDELGVSWSNESCDLKQSISQFANNFLPLIFRIPSSTYSLLFSPGASCYY